MAMTGVARWLTSSSGERRGTRSGVLADFFIGAHAAVRDIPVLTRDTSRIRTYFPTVVLISPQ